MNHRPRSKTAEPWHTYKLVPAMLECRRHAIEVMRAIDSQSEDYRLASNLNDSILAALRRYDPAKFDSLIGISVAMPVGRPDEGT